MAKRNNQTGRGGKVRGGKAGLTKSRRARRAKIIAKIRKAVGVDPGEPIVLRDLDTATLAGLLGVVAKGKGGARKGTRGAKRRDDPDEDEDDLDAVGDDDADDDLDDADEDADDEDADDEDDVDEDSDEADDDEDLDGDADEDDDDSDEDDDEDADDEGDVERDSLTGERRQSRIAASRAAIADPTVRHMARATLKTQLRETISRGAVLPHVADRLTRLFTDERGNPNRLALSAVPGSGDPLLFKILNILRHNKPGPRMRERTGSQHALALGREIPGNTDRGTGGSLRLGAGPSKKEKRELDRQEAEDVEWAKKQARRRKLNKRRRVA